MCLHNQHVTVISNDIVKLSSLYVLTKDHLLLACRLSCMGSMYTSRTILLAYVNRMEFYVTPPVLDPPCPGRKRVRAKLSITYTT